MADFQRRHYQKLADALQSASANPDPNYTEREKILYALTEMLKSDNDAFNRKLFLTASGEQKIARIIWQG